MRIRPRSVAGDRAHGATTEAEHACRALDRVVCLRAGIDRDRSIDAIGGWIAPDALEGALARGAQSEQIGDRAAAAIDALHRLQTEHLGQPFERERFQEIEGGVPVALR